MELYYESSIQPSDDTEALNLWADLIFFSEMIHCRREFGFNGYAILILDVCTVHCSDYFMNMCTFRELIQIFMILHPSDQWQILDPACLVSRKSYSNNSSSLICCKLNLNKSFEFSEAGMLLQHDLDLNHIYDGKIGLAELEKSIQIDRKLGVTGKMTLNSPKYLNVFDGLLISMGEIPQLPDFFNDRKELNDLMDHNIQQFGASTIYDQSSNIYF